MLNILTSIAAKSEERARPPKPERSTDSALRFKKFLEDDVSSGRGRCTGRVRGSGRGRGKEDVDSASGWRAEVERGV